jgi:hypothetical protein
MGVTYKILTFDATIGQILVAFYKDEEHLETYTIDLPVVDGAFISGPVLDAHIMQLAPNWKMQRMADTAAATNASAIRELVSVAANATPTLDQYKTAKTAVINRHREKLLGNGVSFGGHVFDSDALSVSRLTAVVTAVNAGATLPAGFAWRSKDNVDVPMTATEVVGLLGTMIVTANTLFQESWVRKQEVTAAADKAALDAVVWGAVENLQLAGEGVPVTNPAQIVTVSELLGAAP